ncbi:MULTISPECIES: hypothetical protein [unclassified Vibrio]|uniref:hypothetical protein n=1 Tax=unclassified Vibrio TaxID=2614977 RepID=UPI0022495A20|nr:MULTISPECIES: hypothetical protein [unclassified Vibrio]MCX2761128.1 hypothetical protein [Vibrio sp. 14G-20]
MQEQEHNKILSLSGVQHMKIKTGTEADYHQCIAIKHEYFKCHDAFEQFRQSAEHLILSGHDKYKSYRTYNSYSYFIHHLYEFLIACHARDFENKNITDKKGPQKNHFIDSLIEEDAHRAVNARIDRISRGQAPSYENDISHYEKLHQNHLQRTLGFIVTRLLVMRLMSVLKTST